MTDKPSVHFGNTTPAGKLNLSIRLSLPSGITITSAVLSCAVHEDSPASDPSAATRITSTSATIDATGKIMTARFENGLVDVDYVITFLPTLSDTEIEPVTTMISVRKYV
jgi:hypothetical protein